MSVPNMHTILNKSTTCMKRKPLLVLDSLAETLNKARTIFWSQLVKSGYPTFTNYRLIHRKKFRIHWRIHVCLSWLYEIWLKTKECKWRMNSLGGIHVCGEPNLVSLCEKAVNMIPHILTAIHLRPLALEVLLRHPNYILQGQIRLILSTI